MYRLRLLGSLSLQDASGAGTSPVVRQRPLAVLALLALARDQGCSRDKLVGYLWPEVEPERARHRLADAVYLIRRSLGEEAVLGAGDTLRLNPEVFEVDVVCFLERVEGNDLEAAVEVYRGPFLDGFYVSGAPEFERWVERERQRLADAYAGALEELAERAEAAGDFRPAVDGWKRLAGHDPYNSRYVLRLMRALSATGDRGNALQVAQEHERRLSEELGIEPDAEFRAVMEGLRNETGRPVEKAAQVGVLARKGESQVESPQRRPWHGRVSPRVVKVAGAVTVGLAVWAIVATVWLVRHERNGARSPAKSVAVLPFANLAGDAEAQHISDGITGAIINNLAKVADLKVISRTSTMQYDGTDKNLRRIGQELGVTSIVEGQVLQVGDRVRVNVQLIDAKTDLNLWADQYDRQVADVFEIQSDIAKRIVSALHATLEPAERLAIERRPTDNVEAYGFYLRAIEYRDRSQTEEDRRTALRMFESAIELDPEFAQAWAELSHLHSLIFWYHWDRSDRRLALAKAAAERAGELQPGSSEAHVAMGFYHYLGHLDYERALAEFDLALQKLPNDAELWAGVGWIKRRQGKFDEAIFNLMKAFELSPRSARLPYNIADTYRYMRDFEAAERYYERARLLNPDWLGPYWRKAVLYAAWQGDTTKARAELDEWRARADSTYRDYTVELYWARRYDEALEWLSASPSQIFQLFPDLNEANVPKTLEIAHINRLMGRTDQARAYYDSARIISEAELLERPDAEWVHSALGIAYAGLGRKEDAIREGRMGVELMPLDKEAVWKGQSRLEQLTQIYILVGEYDAAIDELDHLLSIPSWLTVPLLRLDPTYDPLRGHPRFETLLAGYE